MHRTTIFFLFVLAGMGATAQSSLDSLLSVWHDDSESDSIRVQAYTKYIFEGFLFSQPDSAFVLAEELHTYALEKDFIKAKASGYNVQGISLDMRGEYRQALDYYHKSLKINEEIKDKKGVASSLSNIGIIYKIQGNYTRGLHYYQRSLKIREEIGDQYGIASTLNNIGIMYESQENYSNALEYYKRSLEIYEEINNKKGIAISLSNIGIIHYRLGDYALALDFYDRSLIISEELEDKNSIASTLINISSAYENQGNSEQAMEYVQQSLKVSEELGDKYGIAISLLELGKNDLKNGKYNDAIANCQRTFDLGKEIESILIQKKACSCLYEAHKAMGKGNKALTYHEQMLVLEDSLDKTETNKQLQQMEFAKQILADSIAVADKERLIQEAHEEDVRQKDKTRNIGFGIGAFFILLAVGFFSRWQYVRKSKARLQIEKDRSDNLLLNILPADIAAELKEKGRAEARDFDIVSILFTDFKSFTQASEKMSARDLVRSINQCFEAFDGICEKYKIEKIKTIGDAYMAAGGLPIPSEQSVRNTILAALDMQDFITRLHKEKEGKGEHAFEMRVGIHTGPVVAGIVGVKKFQYDIWGDTVNTASRVESAGDAGKVNISEATYKLVKDEPDFIFESRGKIEAKGKGAIEMYFVNRSFSEG